MAQSTETRKVTIEIISSNGGTPNPIKPEPTNENGKIERKEFDKLESILINQAYNQAKSVVKQLDSALQNHILRMVVQFVPPFNFLVVETEN